jgi:hypothetical protein
MDTLRGSFDSGEPVDDSQDWDAHEHEVARELPPHAIGQDERRMQVRAYNHWAGLLDDKSFPSIEDLEPENLPDFGPNSVLLDFSAGIEDPIVVYLGDKLREECSGQGLIERLSDVPSRSLLSRITDHYLQILANQAPIGFEAEFVNQRGASILYRGILLPFSSNDETIDFIFGVINWKEMADQVTSDELLLEIDQAIEASEAAEIEIEAEAHKHHPDPVTDWADSPAYDLSGESGEAVSNIEPFTPAYDSNGIELDEDGIPMPDFGQYHLDDPDEEEEEYDDSPGYSFASLTDHIAAPTKKAIDLESAQFDASHYRVEYGDEAFDPAPAFEEPGFAALDGFDTEAPYEELGAEELEAEEFAPEAIEEPVEDPVEELVSGAMLAEDAGLYDTLASARELADTARLTEDRSRHTLYAAVSRAYDFSLMAQENLQEYRDLLEDSGLTFQDRAPMTPVVKLVFGADYDKTRLTEYAAVLGHAHRLGLERGTLSEFLTQAQGGLKGVVQAERRLRREESGQEVETEKAVRRALAKQLRALEALTLDALNGDGPEFGLVMIRRNAQGVAEVIGEIAEDVPMIERAARKLVG